MVVQKIEMGEFKNRYLAENMRSNKEVWIDEYFNKTQVNAELEEETRSIATLAQEVKKIHSSLIIYIHEVIENNNATYVIYDLPRGVRLKPLVKYDEKTVLEIGNNLVKTLLSLHGYGIGINNLRPEEIYLEPHKDIHLLFGNWVSLLSKKSNSDEEIKSIGNILYFLILGETPNHSDEVEEKLKVHCSDLVSNIIIRMLSDEEDQKFKRLEQIVPLLEEKKRVNSDAMILSDETEVSVSHKIYRSLIILIAVIFLYSVIHHPKALTLEEISVFDKVRFHVLGYIGVEEAQRALGEIYEKGYGVKQDYQESIEWYKKAAQKGNVYAQMSLGHLYDQGIGVAIDKKQALYWFTLAAANGDKVAKENVAIYTQPAMHLRSTENSTQSPEVNSNTIAKQSDTQIQQTKNEQSISVTKRLYHTYWLHSGSSNNLQKSNQYGGIYGCYEDGFQNPVELVSFSQDVRSMAVDGEGNLYWADITTGQIIKSDSNGKNVRVIIGRLSHPMGIAIDRKRKLLFWSDRQQNQGGFSGGIGRSDLDGNNVKYIALNGLVSGGKLKVDENEAKLYIPDILGKKIVRINEDGQNMIGLVFAIKPEGFDIDTTRRKLYWTDDLNSGIYESDYDGSNKRIVYTYYTTDENFETVMFNPINQRIYFGKLSPGSQSIWSVALSNEATVRTYEYVTNFKIHDIIKN